MNNLRIEIMKVDVEQTDQMIQVIHGEIWSENFTELNELIRDFQSCVRFSYCRFNKNNLEFNDVRKASKIKYPKLNTRQISDAVLQGHTYQNVSLAQQEVLIEIKSKIEVKLKKKISVIKKEKLEKRLKYISYLLNNRKVVFGGRKKWNDFKSGVITKNEWLNNRDSQLYCRGDKSQKGNLNIRVIGNTLRITIGTRKWITYKLFIPNKYQSRLKSMLDSGRAYNVRIKRKDDQHFKVIIDYQIACPKVTVEFKNGVIGVDTNPDRIAVADVTADGNLVTVDTFINTRILYASGNKRDYDIGCLVKNIIQYAKRREKGIVFENLNFNKDKLGSRQWRSKQSNFVWRKFLTLLERKCVENGIQYKKVNPAFTSIIGKYKYRWMHKITIHESAAYVIGRRGMNFNEKLSFYKADANKVKELVLGTLAEKYQNNKVHSWLMWKHLNDNIEAVLTGLQVSLADLKEFVGNIWYRGETLRGEVFLQELLAESKV